MQEPTNDELREAIRARYQAAVDDGTVGRICFVARMLGSDPAGPGFASKCGPKYLWKHGNIRVFVDDYGNYANVDVANKPVMSTHYCNQFIIPGVWIDTVLGFHDDAVREMHRRKEDRAGRERVELLARLG